MEKGQQLNTPIVSFFVCEKSLTLWFFHSFLLILVLAPQFYPRCIASKERKTERESESWLKRHVWWMSIKTKTKEQNKHWEYIIVKQRGIVMSACSCAFIWTQLKKISFLLSKWLQCVKQLLWEHYNTPEPRPRVLESHTVTSQWALALTTGHRFHRLHLSGSPEQEGRESERGLIWKKSMGWGWEAE